MTPVFQVAFLPPGKPAVEFISENLQDSEIAAIPSGGVLFAARCRSYGSCWIVSCKFNVSAVL